MEVAKLAAPPNLEVRFVSCNESAIKRWLSSELEETVFSLTHELFMSKQRGFYSYANIKVRVPKIRSKRFKKRNVIHRS